MDGMLCPNWEADMDLCGRVELMMVRRGLLGTRGRGRRTANGLAWRRGGGIVFLVRGDGGIGMGRGFGSGRVCGRRQRWMVIREARGENAAQGS